MIEEIRKLNTYEAPLCQGVKFVTNISNMIEEIRKLNTYEAPLCQGVKFVTDSMC
jgi:hypothetical protein